MEIYRAGWSPISMDRLPWGPGKPAVGIGLGNFDGVHLGHGALLRCLREECEKAGIPSLVYTFSGHPDHILHKETSTPLLMTEAQKCAILEEEGMDYVYLERFDETYAAMEPEEFVRKILVERFGIRLAVVGYDYSFGRFGAGDPSALIDMGKRYGFQVFVVPPVQVEGVVLSSTLLRQLVKDGEMERFAQYTGRRYSIPGEVAVGRKVGRTLGFPTANILPREGFALPGCGVYQTITKIDATCYKSVTNIGDNPTFPGNTRITVETHILEYNQRLYGQYIEVFFVRKLREECTFPSVDALRDQLQRDIAASWKGENL